MPLAHANQGLQATYYNNQTEDNQYNDAPPIPPTVPVVASIPVATVDQDYDQYPIAGLIDDFVVKYEGFITATDSATAEIQCLADDGCIVIINGQTIINEWWDKGTDGGIYTYDTIANQSLPFTVWYYENGGGAVIQLRWRFAGSDWTVVPESVFSTETKVSTGPTPAELATLEAARIESERLAALAETARIESERQAALVEAQRIEAERQAALAEAARKAAEEEAKRQAIAAEAARQAAIAAELARQQELARQAAVAAEQERQRQAFIAAEQARIKAEEEIRLAEADRKMAEMLAKIAEDERKQAEEDARIAEELRIQAEEDARIAEENAKKAEEERIKAEEEAKIAEEKARLAEEEAKKAEEDAKRAEEERIKAEQERIKAEEERVKAEQEKIKTEEERIKAEAKAKADAEAKAKAEEEAKPKPIPTPTPKPEPVVTPPPVIPTPEPTKVVQDSVQVVDDAKADGVVTEEETQAIVAAVIADAISSGDAITTETLAEAGIEYKDLPPETPVELDNGVVITAEVAVQVELLQNPSEFVSELFTNPTAAFAALGNVGADMTPEVRAKSEKVVIAAVIAGNIATTAATSAAAVAAYRRKP
jgi:hypothetical protein